MAAPSTALTIAGSDSGGGAGIQADLKTFLGCGVHGMSAVTAVTVQNSIGVSGFYELPPHAVAEQIESVVTDIGVDAAKTGMLASAAIMAAVAKTVRRLAVAPLVVDPVAASQHGDPLLRPDAIDALRTEIIPLATLVTPNVGEVRLLTGVEVSGPEDVLEAARRLHALGADWVLVKGGHRSAPMRPICSMTATGHMSSPRPGRTRSTLTARATPSRPRSVPRPARGSDMPEAVRLGKAYVTQAITSSYPLGSGLGPVGHFWRIRDWPGES